MIEVVCGPMFAGKSERLVDEFQSAASGTAIVVKPAFDDRDGVNLVKSHKGREVPAIPCHTAGDILHLAARPVQSVLIDEVQFFGPAILSVVSELHRRGLVVRCYGLDLDSNGLPFGCMGDLMALANYVVKLFARCSLCGQWARKTQRTVSNDSRVFVGGSESYEPRCDQCWGRSS